MAFYDINKIPKQLEQTALRLKQAYTVQLLNFLGIEKNTAHLVVRIFIFYS